MTHWERCSTVRRPHTLCEAAVVVPHVVIAGEGSVGGLCRDVGEKKRRWWCRHPAFFAFIVKLPPSLRRALKSRHYRRRPDTASSMPDLASLAALSSGFLRLHWIGHGRIRQALGQIRLIAELIHRPKQPPPTPVHQPKAPPICAENRRRDWREGRRGRGG